MALLEQIKQQLIDGEDEQTAALTAQAIAEGLPPERILDEGLIAGMDVIGANFKAHEIFLPDVLLAARAMHAAMEQLKPLLISEGIPNLGRVAIGSVQGDLHDIGKNLVGILLKGAGFEVLDLGNNVSPERFVEAVKEQDAQVVGMSALLTTTMPKMRDVINLLGQAGFKDRVKTIVGGAPVSQEFADDIGADAYGFDAANAVDRVKGLVGV